MIISNDEQKPSFGENEGIWEYKNIDGNLLGYAVRKVGKNGKKRFEPWTYQENEWVRRWLPDQEFKPFYNAHLLKTYPEAKVLICEGEKTADAAQKLFSDLVCITWMGGAQSAKKIDPEYLKNRKVCLWPDNDAPGINAMESIYQKIKNIAECAGIIKVENLGLPKKWDLADFDEINGELDLELIKKLIDDSFVHIPKEPLWEFDVGSYPELNGSEKNPKPLDTTKNLKHLLDHYSITVRWNMMKRLREATIPNVKLYQEEAENQALTYITNLAVTHDFNIRRIDKHLDQISWENTYHPVRDWILKTPLKNKTIFNDFLKTIETTNNELSYTLIKRWMISAIAALFNDGGFCAQGVLVIQGEPGTHKSSFIASLVPTALKAIKGGLSLDPTKKDDIFTSSEYWIAELAELDATFRKADIARLKAHITNDMDDVRRPHAVRNSKMIRRTVFAATVNENNFLVDTTGNRRWWTISVTDKIKTRHGLDMQQVWRAAYDMFLSGESPILLENELALLNEENKQYEFIDPFDEKLDAYFRWDKPPTAWMNCTQILNVMGYKSPTRSDTTRMSSVLKIRNLVKGKGSTKMKRCYLMPAYRIHHEKM